MNLVGFVTGFFFFLFFHFQLILNWNDFLFFIRIGLRSSVHHIVFRSDRFSNINIKFYSGFFSSCIEKPINIHKIKIELGKISKSNLNAKIVENLSKNTNHDIHDRWQHDDKLYCQYVISWIFKLNTFLVLTGFYNIDNKWLEQKNYNK